VLEALAAEEISLPVRCLAIPDQLVEHGDARAIRARLGLDAAGIAAAVRSLLRR
jgi:1-deoxy-D-xylulose-5-phosphate synthase